MVAQASAVWHSAMIGNGPAEIWAQQAPPAQSSGPSQKRIAATSGNCSQVSRVSQARSAQHSSQTSPSQLIDPPAEAPPPPVGPEC